MEIFLSWSGEQSKKIAETLKSWLPSVIQSLKPFYSSNDISKGKRWDSELSKSLNKCEFGIIILTEENRTAPWIMFEAGALAKNIETGRVCTFLFDIKDTDVVGPLSSFQNTKYDKQDVLKLLEDINNYLGDIKIEKEVLVRVFEKMWPDLDTELKKILTVSSKPKKEIRDDREILEESLRLLRNIHYKHTRFSKNDFEFNREERVIYEKEQQAVIFYTGETEEYWIGIDQLNTTGEILDFIFQVNGKRWCTSKHIREFINCIEEMSGIIFGTSAQGIICPGGALMEIDWENKKVSEFIIKETKFTKKV
ncbi:TIR domain-containing protein [Flavobacterium silvisoli]|uniref:TIR domain-containing protein n=1 Tax=Flavobacterium silvisoli TaxID=2529433 RepID=A0A4Q9YNI2_9FLAO|nr:TIR domain-containing protein [Flavobacterium silvisoli]TBX64778.1 TIR domain-containing protein [Flavobacterium silvisoli]